MANHLEAGPHVLQHLGGVLAERRSLPPQSGQAKSGGKCVWISRGRCSGSGRPDGRAPVDPFKQRRELGAAQQLIRPVRGFKSPKTAYATIMGFEVMRALPKGQAMFNLTRDIGGEARIVERAFGIGASALAETIAAISEKVNFQPA